MPLSLNMMSRREGEVRAKVLRFLQSKPGWTFQACEIHEALNLQNYLVEEVLRDLIQNGLVTFRKFEGYDYYYAVGTRKKR